MLKYRHIAKPKTVMWHLEHKVTIDKPKHLKKNELQENEKDLHYTI